MLTYALVIWTAAHISGGHFNPAVTTAFICTSRIHWLKGVFYIQWGNPMP